MLLNRIIYLFVFILFFSCSQQSDPQAILLLQEGVALLDEKNFDEAQIAFKKTLSYKLDEELESKVYRNLSIVFQNKGSIDSALFYSKKGFEMAPDNSYLYYINRAEYALLENDIKLGVENLKIAEKQNPSEMEVYSLFCSIYSGDYGDAYFNPFLAERYAKKAYHITPCKITKEQLGAVYFQNERYGRAVRIFKELSGAVPSDQRYKFYLGQSLFFSGKESQGVWYMKQAADRDDSCNVMFKEIFPN
jgi:tetratricopeptide (TPR) repeat protein